MMVPDITLPCPVCGTPLTAGHHREFLEPIEPSCYWPCVEYSCSNGHTIFIMDEEDDDDDI